MALRQSVSTDAAPEAIGPYSQAIRSGSLLFCSGQIPLDPSSGELVKEDIEGQARRCLENLAAVCEAAGALARRRRALHGLPDRHERLRARERGRTGRSSRDPIHRPAWRSAWRRCRRAPTSRSTRSSRSSQVTRSGPPSTSRCSPRSTRAAQALEGVVDVGETRVERWQAEADRVGTAEVGDHLGPLDQGAADRPGLGVARGSRGRRGGPRRAGCRARSRAARGARREVDGEAR